MRSKRESERARKKKEFHSWFVSLDWFGDGWLVLYVDLVTEYYELWIKYKKTNIIVLKVLLLTTKVEC